MTLEQLRIFVAVAERQHVTRGAAALNLAQSAASAAISALEASNGTRLFDRVGRGIVLTEAGRVFLGEARAVLARAEAAGRVLASFGALERGSLAVHASQTIASYWLPRHLVAFRRAFPGVALSLSVGNTAEVAAAVEERVAEVGFVEGAVESPLLEAVPVARDHLIVVVAPDHPWATRKGLQPADLMTAGWVVREAGSGTRSAFEDALRAGGLDPQQLEIAMQMPTNEAVRAAVEAGMGAAALSGSVAAGALEAGLLAAVDIRLPPRTFSVLTHRERQPSPLCAAFLGRIVRGAGGP